MLQRGDVDGLADILGRPLAGALGSALGGLSGGGGLMVLLAKLLLLAAASRG